MLPVYSTESLTSPKDGLIPKWPPEVDRRVPEPIAEGAKQSQTSKRPRQNGLTVNNGSSDVGGDGTGHRMLFLYRATSSNTSRDEMTSAEDARDKALTERTLLSLQQSPSSGEYSQPDRASLLVNT